MNTFVGQVGLVDSESSGWPREGRFVWVLSGGINQVDGEWVTHHLLGGLHDGVEARSHSSFEERLISDVLQALREEQWGYLSRAVAEFLSVTAAGVHEEFFEALGGDGFILVAFFSGAFVESGEEG